jgi:hypothetical protein
MLRSAALILLVCPNELFRLRDTPADRISNTMRLLGRHGCRNAMPIVNEHLYLHPRCAKREMQGPRDLSVRPAIVCRSQSSLLSIRLDGKAAPRRLVANMRSGHQSASILRPIIETRRCSVRTESGVSAELIDLALYQRPRAMR